MVSPMLKVCLSLYTLLRSHFRSHLFVNCCIRRYCLYMQPRRLKHFATINFSTFEMATQEDDGVLNWWKERVTSAPPETLPEPGKVHCPEHHDLASRTAILFCVSDDARSRFFFWRKNLEPRCELWLMHDSEATGHLMPEARLRQTITPAVGVLCHEGNCTIEVQNGMVSCVCSG